MFTTKGLSNFLFSRDKSTESESEKNDEMIKINADDHQ